MLAAWALKVHEEGHIQSLADRAQVAVEARIAEGAPRIAALVRVAGAKTLSLVNGFFGPRLLTAGAAWSSAWVSVASIVFVFCILPPADIIDHPWAFRILNLGGLCAALVVAYIPRMHPRMGVALWGIVTTIIVSATIVFDIPKYGVAASVFALLLSIPLGGIVSDLAALALLKWALRFISEGARTWRILLAAGALLLVLAGLFRGPIAAFIQAVRWIMTTEELAAVKNGSSLEKVWVIGPFLVSGFITFSNLFSGAIISGFLVVLVSVASVKTIACLLDRLLYATKRFGVFGSRKLIFGVGAACFGVGTSPQTSELIRFWLRP